MFKQDVYIQIIEQALNTAFYFVPASNRTTCADILDVFNLLTVLKRAQKKFLEKM